MQRHIKFRQADERNASGRERREHDGNLETFAVGMDALPTRHRAVRFAAGASLALVTPIATCRRVPEGRASRDARPFLFGLVAETV